MDTHLQMIQILFSGKSPSHLEAVTEDSPTPACCLLLPSFLRVSTGPLASPHGEMV